MLHRVDLVSAPLPIPSILFFTGLVLWVVFSVVVRRGIALHGYDPLRLAGLSGAERSELRYSISKRRLADDPSRRSLAIEWSEYEVGSGWRRILQGVLGTLAVLLILCVAYDFKSLPILVVTVAIIQALLLFLNVFGTVVHIRRLPACEQLARDGGFEPVSPSAAVPESMG